MTALVNIIRNLTTADGRATHELPRGLWLVYYPPADDQPARLIAARYLSAPSPTELRVVRDALLDALDAHASRVPVDVAPEWADSTRGDWHGHVITWRMLPTTDAFSRDDELRRRVRAALEQREQRELKRRQRQRASGGDPAPHG